MPAGWPGRSLGLLALLPVLLARPAPVAPGTLEITMLDVGHGLAIVARTAQHTLVYDAGPAWSSDSDAGARIVLPYLRGEGVRRIDMLVVSHDDIDHSGGAVSLLRSLPVDALVSSLPAGHPAFAYMLQPLRCHAGQQWTWDAVQFRILHPEWDSYAERSVDNERSCVLQVEAAGVRALITGDIGVRSEARLLAAERRTGSRLLASAVLLVPHHGSGGSSSAAFVSAVAPQHALMSIGYLNRFGHPRPDVVERYRAAGANLLRTDQAGAVRLTIAGDGIVVRREREHARRYWRARPP
jgi:competence protein ComEC